MVQRNQYQIPGMAETELTVSCLDIDAVSPLNHNELHIHKACEIYINLSGDVFFEVENRQYPIERGSVIITRPYEYHHCIYRSNAPHAHYWITFSMEESEYLRLFYRREKGRGNLILLSEEQLQHLCKVLEGLRSSHGDALKQRIAFLQMLDILQSGNAEEAVENTVQLPEDVRKALILMDQQLGQEVDIGSIAGACGVSISTLERHFKTSLGASPGAAPRKKRLNASMQQLRCGAAVSEAAQRCGFLDDSNYIQHFRKAFGMTPLQYKRLFQTKHA